MLRVAQQQLKLALQDVPDRPPVDAGGLHRDVRDAVLSEPVTQRQQPAHRRLELPHQLRTRVALPGRAHARRHLLLVHIKRPGTLDNPIHRL